MKIYYSIFLVALFFMSPSYAGDVKKEAQALVDQGFLFLNDGKFEESLSQFDKAITLIPTNPYNVPRKLDHQNAKVRYNLTNQWGSK